jgi:hypothetical protein
VFLFRGAALSEVASVTFNNNLLTVGGTIGQGTLPIAPIEVYYQTVSPGIGTVGTNLATYTFTPGGTVAAGGAGTNFTTAIPFGASLSIAYGTGGGLGTIITPNFGSLTTLGTTAGTSIFVPAPGYGYSLSGFDTITDFEVATDQIRLSASLFTNGTNIVSANAPGAFASFATASAANLTTLNPNNVLVYAQDTGILYGRVAGASTPGSQYIYDPAPVFFRGTVLPSNDPSLPTPGTIVGTLQYYVLPQTNPLQAVAFPGTTAAPTSSLPIPFAQVLNSAGAPVTDLTYGRDIVIF